MKTNRIVYLRGFVIFSYNKHQEELEKRKLYEDFENFSKSFNIMEAPKIIH